MVEGAECDEPQHQSVTTTFIILHVHITLSFSILLLKYLQSRRRPASHTDGSEVRRSLRAETRSKVHKKPMKLRKKGERGGRNGMRARVSHVHTCCADAAGSGEAGTRCMLGSKNRLLLRKGGGTFSSRIKRMTR